MAFCNNEEGTNNKQHINLSITAYEIMLNDMFAFGENSISGFINTVFFHFYPIANASISLTLNRLLGKLIKQMAETPGDERTKKHIIDKLVKDKVEELKNKCESYVPGKAFKFWLNKSNLEYLTQKNSECKEDKYYSRRGKYIKCVIEEYAQLPFIERERIYFSPWMNEIEYAVCEECQLRVVTETGFVYSVYPYKLSSDPLSISNYLIGYCKRYNFPNDEKRPCSFKISSLKSLTLEKSKSAFLKNSEKKSVEKTISSRGVQFMVSNETEIYVRLTDKGVEKYHRQVHLRPAFVRKENDICVFQCTTAQAEFYFFKFGADAEILLPTELRQKFKLMYKSAVNTYN